MLNVRYFMFGPSSLALIILFIILVSLSLGKIAMIIVRAVVFAFLLTMNLFQRLKYLYQRSLVFWHRSSKSFSCLHLFICLYLVVQLFLTIANFNYIIAFFVSK